MDLIYWLVVGLVAGALARLVIPGRDPMGWLGTLVLGLVGALIGGFLFSLLGDNDGIGLIGAFVGAVIALLVYRKIGAGSGRGTPVGTGTRRL